MLAAQKRSCLGCEAAENHVGGVDDEPVVLLLSGLRRISASHSVLLSFEMESFVDPSPAESLARLRDKSASALGGSHSGADAPKNYFSTVSSTRSGRLARVCSALASSSWSGG